MPKDGKRCRRTKKNENRKTRMQPLLPTPRCTFPRSLNATLSLRLRQQRRPCVLSSSVNKRAAAEARKHFHTRIDQTQTRQRVMATGGGLGERRASGEGVQLPSAAFQMLFSLFHVSDPLHFNYLFAALLKGLSLYSLAALCVLPTPRVATLPKVNCMQTKRAFRVFSPSFSGFMST